MELPPEPPRIVIPLHAEEAEVSRREIVTGTVKVETVTRLRDERIQEMLATESAEIERVEIRELVDAMPDIRTEGDTIIVPVVEEVLVVERRLFLKEEVRIRRVRRTDLHEATVTLREQDAVITRAGPPDPVARNPLQEPGDQDAE
jgi:stress response protein YsnF